MDSAVFSLGILDVSSYCTKKALLYTGKKFGSIEWTVRWKEQNSPYYVNSSIII